MGKGQGVGGRERERRKGTEREKGRESGIEGRREGGAIKGEGERERDTERKKGREGEEGK